MKKNNDIVSREKKLFWSSFCLGLFLNTCLLGATASMPLKQQEDSLLNILSYTEDSAQKIGLLRDLASLNRHTAQEIVYSRQMLEIADRIDSTHCSYEALFSLCRYYCNAYELDSLRYWATALDSTAKVHNEIPEERLLVHSALCRLYIIRSEYEMAMDEAVKQQILSEQSNNQLGLVFCNESWGLIYMATCRYEEAAQALDRCVSLLKKMDNEYIYILQVNECLIRTYLYLKDYQKTEEALNYQEEVLAIIKADNKVTQKIYGWDEIFFILETYRVRFYSEMNMPDKALAAIKKLTPYKEFLSKSYIPPIYNLAMANYYYMIKDFRQALDYINAPIDQDAPYFELKAAIFTAMGKKQAALEVYQQYMAYGKSQRELAFTRQINQLGSLHKLQEEEKTAQRLILQEKELQNKVSQLQGIILLSCILLVSLGLWVWYLIRTKKLKDTLVKEQIALKETNCDLQVAKEKAENAEKMKSNFVANISHEIRTPLNAIASFAAMLKESSPDERAEYIRIINNNSDLLLNLVSDVLDLSRLSDANFALNIQPINLEECCQHALSTVNSFISPHVKAIFTHPEKAFEMNTDALRLQQLLVNLLSNAAKFTEKGEIVLDYKVDEATSSVQFSVSDTGCGISLKKQELIFGCFEKESEFKQGEGLGLSICQAIAKRFGGHLSVDPAYTSGARFIFTMPFDNHTDK